MARSLADMEQVQRINWKGWRADLGIALAGGALIGLTWFAVIERTRYEVQAATSDIERANGNLAIAFEEYTDQALKRAEQLLRLVAHQYEIEGTTRHLREFIRNGTTDPELVVNVLVINQAGAVVFSNVEMPAMSSDFTDRPFFSAHMEPDSGKVFIGQSQLGRITGKRVFLMSRRISKTDGAFSGVVAAALDPDYFVRFYQKAELGANDAVVLTGLDGTVRAGRTGNTLGHDFDVKGDSLMQAQARAPNGNVITTGQFDRVDRFYSYRTLERYPLVIGVGRSVADALAKEQKREKDYYAAATLGTSVIAILTMALIAWSRSRAKGARIIARRDARFRATFDQAGVGMVHADLECQILHANRAFCTMLDYVESEVHGRLIAHFTHPEDRVASRDVMQRLLADTTTRTSALTQKRYSRRDGSTVWCEVAVSLVRDADHRPDYFVCVVQDISARKRAEERLVREVNDDSLTQMPNRRLCVDRIGQVLAQAHRRNERAALLCLDLDRFKSVNDTIGQKYGDKLLQQIAGRLSACVRAEDTVARLGGDEFGVLLPRVADPSDAGIVARKMLDALMMPFEVASHRLFVGASIGIACYPADAREPEVMIANAEAAMSRARELGGGMFQFYTAEMNAHSTGKSQTERGVRRASAATAGLARGNPAGRATR